MALTLTGAAGLTAAEVVHRRFRAMPAVITIGEVSAWFAESPRHRMAFLADGDSYVGSLTSADLEGQPPERPAAELAHPGPLIGPDASARAGYDLAVATDARRVPVVDQHGRLVGVVAVTEDLASFCGVGD